jgi:hypothetical protein
MEKKTSTSSDLKKTLEKQIKEDLKVFIESGEDRVSRFADHCNRNQVLYGAPHTVQRKKAQNIYYYLKSKEGESPAYNTNSIVSPPIMNVGKAHATPTRSSTPSRVPPHLVSKYSYFVIFFETFLF